jgi:hypothetical protein
LSTIYTWITGCQRYVSFGNIGAYIHDFGVFAAHTLRIARHFRRFTMHKFGSMKSLLEFHRFLLRKKTCFIRLQLIFGGFNGELHAVILFYFLRSRTLH